MSCLASAPDRAGLEGRSTARRACLINWQTTAARLPPAKSPSDREAVAIDAERVRVPCDPAHNLEAIIHGGRKRMLGRKPVIDGDHPASAPIGQEPAQPLVRFDVADDETATMKIDEALAAGGRQH